jgi:D-3-phosphoglycerate dehydrogenase
MKIVFVDANDTLANVMEDMTRGGSIEVVVNRQPDLSQEAMFDLIKDAQVAIIDHTPLPTEMARLCPDLRDVVFLGTGARSYMNPEELSALDITVHTIKGYGDTAVAECAFALMWAGARSFAMMDREMRKGNWRRTEALQLTGKTLGLIGFGGIAREVSRLALGCSMKVLAWNRSPRVQPGVEFVELEQLLAESHVISLHLLLTDETKGFLSKQRIASMRPGVILVNTARGALVDESAMIDALISGQIRHAGLDVFDREPLPESHPLTGLANVTLSAHSAFRTQEANENLIRSALDRCKRIESGESSAPLV